MVKNLPPSVTEDRLRKDFGDMGTVTDVRLLTNERGRSRRVAFVGFKTAEESARAIRHFHDSYYGGAKIVVEEAKSSTEAASMEAGDTEYRDRKRRAMEMVGMGVEEMKGIIQMLEKRNKKVWTNEVPAEEREERAEKPEKSEKEEIAEIMKAHMEASEKEKRERILDSGQIFVQGLPFSAEEGEVEEFFSQHGPVAEVLVPFRKTKDSWGDGAFENKGHAIVTYTFPENAVRVYEQKGLVFQGRLVRVDSCRSSRRAEEAPSQSKNRSNLNHGPGHNALFFNFGAIVSTVAARQKIKKRCMLEETGRGVGGKVTLMESSLIEETKRFMREEGISEGCACPRQGGSECKCAVVSKKSLLLKNIPYDTKESEIRKHFRKYARILFPPSRLLAILEYNNSADAAEELRRNNYAKIRDTPVYIERLRVTQERFARESSEARAPGPAELRSCPKKGEEVGTKLIIKNVPFQAGRHEVSEIVAGVLPEGGFKLRFPRKFDGTHRGFCFVGLSSEDDARALYSRLKDAHLYGRHLVVEPANL